MIVNWRKARDLLTGEAGDGLTGANEAQDILDDLARWRDKNHFYRNSQGSGYLSYHGKDADNQPLYLYQPNSR